MSGSIPPRTRRPKEVIERLPGGFLIDVENNRSIETAEMVAELIKRIWPEVANHMAALFAGKVVEP